MVLWVESNLHICHDTTWHLCHTDGNTLGEYLLLLHCQRLCVHTCESVIGNRLGHRQPGAGCRPYRAVFPYDRYWSIGYSNDGLIPRHDALLLPVVFFSRLFWRKPDFW